MSMLDYYSRWSELLVSGYESGLTTGRMLTLSGDLKGVVICGMGGSGVSGDFLVVLGRIYGSKLPIHVFKDFDLPTWYSNHLVIAVSYSGNTWETLECSRRAREMNASVIHVSSGGLLKEEAERNGLPWVRIEPGLVPRAALPLMVGALLGLTDSLNITMVGEEAVLEAYNVLKNTMVDEARGLVEVVGDSEVLVVGACGHYGILAERFRSEFSENTKMLVKAEVYPESAHNDIVAWQSRRRVKIAFIAIRGGGGVCGEIMNFIIDKYRGHGPLAELELGAPSLSSILRGALIGGYASVLLAGERRVEALATPIIDEYKRVLARVTKV